MAKSKNFKHLEGNANGPSNACWGDALRVKQQEKQLFFPLRWCYFLCKKSEANLQALVSDDRHDDDEVAKNDGDDEYGEDDERNHHVGQVVLQYETPVFDEYAGVDELTQKLPDVRDVLLRELGTANVREVGQLGATVWREGHRPELLALGAYAAEREVHELKKDALRCVGRLWKTVVDELPAARAGILVIVFCEVLGGLDEKVREVQRVVEAHRTCGKIDSRWMRAGYMGVRIQAG